jgi:hypothetical protein
VANNWWRGYFDIKSVESSGWKFAGEIITDGKPVSITLSKAAEPSHPSCGTDNAPEENNIEYDKCNVWGIDSGQRDIITAVNGAH